MSGFRRFGLLVASALSLTALWGGSAAALGSYNPFQQICAVGGKGSTVCNPAPDKDPISGTGGVLLKAVDIISYVVGITSVIFVIVGAIRYIISNGDSQKVGVAKNTIMYALIGVAVTILARVIILFVIQRL